MRRHAASTCHLAAAAAALLLAACVTATGSSARLLVGSEISPSVMLIGRFDWEVERNEKGELWSRCLDQLWRAAERSGSSQISFVPTHHWLPPVAVSSGPGAAADTRAVGAFCTMEGTTGQNQCGAWSPGLRALFRDSMRVCFAEALSMGLTISLRPHLDDGTGRGAWRNGLLFRPAEKYGGISYYDLMLVPLADALRGALEDTQARRAGEIAKPTIYFAMQGEMSATVMRYPRDWAALVAPLRERVGPLAETRLGIGLNFNRLDDTSSTGQTFDSSRVSWLLWALGVTDGLSAAGAGGAPPPVDAEGVAMLLEQRLDFVGVSAYAPLTGLGFAPKELENSAFMLGDEMRNLGINLQALIDQGSLELHYSEAGLGGGGGYSGTMAASNPSEVALRPFYGVYGPYTAAGDPWAVPANRQLLREYYSKLAAWLADPGNKTYRVSRVFIWCLASWDVLGVYPESTTREGSYYDPVVGRIVRAHNAALRGLTSIQSSGPSASGVGTGDGSGSGGLGA